MAKVILYSLKMTAEPTVYPLLSQLTKRCPLTIVCLLFSVPDVNYSLLLFKQSGVLDPLKMLHQHYNFRRCSTKAKATHVIYGGSTSSSRNGQWSKILYSEPDGAVRQHRMTMFRWCRKGNVPRKWRNSISTCCIFLTSVTDDTVRNITEGNLRLFIAGLNLKVSVVIFKT